MMILACSACQMQRLGPDIIYLVLWLLPAYLCYLLCRHFEESSSMAKGALGLFLFGLFFVVCIGVMPLLLVLLVPMLALFLLVKLFSKSRASRIAALVGLFPFFAIVGHMAWQRKASGVFYPLDQAVLSERVMSHEVWGGKKPFGLEQHLILEALHTGSGTRNQNARAILLEQVKVSKNEQSLTATLSQLQEMVGSGKISVDYVQEYQAALESVSQRRRDEYEVTVEAAEEESFKETKSSRSDQSSR